METSMISLEISREADRQLSLHDSRLRSIGMDEWTITKANLFFGCLLPVYGGQLRGFYIHNGKRESHFAVPGWYVIEDVNGGEFIIRKPFVENADPFVFGAQQLLFCLDPNLDYAIEGLSPGR